MKSNAALRLLLAVFLLLAFSFLVVRDCRTTVQSLDWLALSEPRFCADIDAGPNSHPIISLLLSNSGPASLTFSLGWTECRAASDLSLVKLHPWPSARSRRPGVLAPGAATNLDFQIADPNPGDEALLFCCQVEWAEKESALFRFSRDIDQPMYTITSLLGTEWKPPWRNKRFVTGEVFASNIEVARYFERAYGFTRQNWIQEQRLVQQRVEELSRQRAAQTPIRTRPRYPRPARRALSSSEQSLELARAAFNEFCRTCTNQPAL
ncbi:MAG TPA: hypothetical protein VL361_14205 [Candidatus Limnocylindrales bacterium]|jgi:hypothetical protein|nr:hypothetical protein [Candidatus Limnocylindrales bacterium]